MKEANPKRLPTYYRIPTWHYGKVKTTGVVVPDCWTGRKGNSVKYRGLKGRETVQSDTVMVDTCHKPPSIVSGMSPSGNCGLWVAMTN